MPPESMQNQSAPRTAWGCGKLPEEACTSLRALAVGDSLLYSKGGVLFSYDELWKHWVSKLNELPSSSRLSNRNIAEGQGVQAFVPGEQEPV